MRRERLAEKINMDLWKRLENGMNGPQKVPPLTADRDNANWSLLVQAVV